MGTIPKAESQLEKKNLIWKLGTLAAGAEQLIRVKITPTDAGEIGSVATVSFSAEVAAKTVIVEPKAQLTVSGPREAAVGEPAPFKFSITNNGPVDLKGVFIRTVLPNQGLTHPGGNDLEYEIGDLPRGKTRDVALSITPAQNGDWHFDSTVTLGGRELAKAQSGLHVVGARLTVVRSGPTKRFVGRGCLLRDEQLVADAHECERRREPAGRARSLRPAIERRSLGSVAPDADVDDPAARAGPGDGPACHRDAQDGGGAPGADRCPRPIRESRGDCDGPGGRRVFIARCRRRS